MDHADFVTGIDRVVDDCQSNRNGASVVKPPSDIYVYPPPPGAYGQGNSNPYDLLNVGGTLYFFASTNPGNADLYMSNGTDNGTVLVKDLVSGVAFPSQLTKVGTRLFFVNYGPGSHGYELWTSDGTEPGTVEVADIQPGSGSSMPAYLTSFNGKLVFAADDGTHGIELWKAVP